MIAYQITSCSFNEERRRYLWHCIPKSHSPADSNGIATVLANYIGLGTLVGTVEEKRRTPTAVVVEILFCCIGQERVSDYLMLSITIHQQRNKGYEWRM